MYSVHIEYRVHKRQYIMHHLQCIQYKHSVHTGAVYTVYTVYTVFTVVYIQLQCIRCIKCTHWMCSVDIQLFSPIFSSTLEQDGPWLVLTFAQLANNNQFRRCNQVTGYSTVYRCKSTTYSVVYSTQYTMYSTVFVKCTLPQKNYLI